MQEFPFPWPNADKGYSLFPKSLEDNPNVLFHGTSADNFDSIVNDGLKSAAELGGGTNQDYRLNSISYAKNSSQCLGHVCNIRDNGNEGDYVVFAFEFDSIEVLGIRINPSDIHVDNPAIRPVAIGYCMVPSDYAFR